MRQVFCPCRAYILVQFIFSPVGVCFLFKAEDTMTCDTPTWPSCWEGDITFVVLSHSSVGFVSFYFLPDSLAGPLWL